MPAILISGASVAGPALAHWMSRAGWDVTVLERAGELREEGQNIDIRGAARDVVTMMGLDAAVRAANTGEEGTEFVDEQGEVVASFEIDEGDGDGPTAELEILRGQLARVLVDNAPEGIEWVFGDQIVGVEDGTDAALVRFEHASERSFDVVAIAEGQRSSTRTLVFPAESVSFEPLGLYIAYATIPRVADDTKTWRWLQMPGSRTVSLRPDNLGTTQAMLTFMSDERGHDEVSREEQVAMLRDLFGDVGWEAPRILAELDDAGFYFEDLALIKAKAWSHGRVVLLGDAAHCVTPLGGGGTSLALIDAYVLALELDRNPDPAVAFDAYEKFMRPVVEDAQDLPPGTPRVSHPSSSLGVRLLRAAEKAAGAAASRGLLPSPTPAIDELELPDQDGLRGG